MKPIHLRNVPPPTETFNHVEFIKYLATWLKPENYLELGVRWGTAFKEIAPMAVKSTAVDVVPCQFQLPNNSIYIQDTTDNFFQKLNQDEKYDLIFIYADHSHEQSLKDFINAEKFLINDGFIILHDTYPYDLSYISPLYCNDCYKTALYIKNNLIKNFEIITLPFNPGLTLIKKIPQNKQLIYLK